MKIDPRAPWEYKVLEELGLPHQVEEQLNLLGAEGWELVAYHEYLYIFKRLKILELPTVDPKLFEEEQPVAPGDSFDENDFLICL